MCEGTNGKLKTPTSANHKSLWALTLVVWCGVQFPRHKWEHNTLGNLELPAALSLTHWLWAHWMKHDIHEYCCSYYWGLSRVKAAVSISQVLMSESVPARNHKITRLFEEGLKLMLNSLSMVSNCLCRCLTAYTEIKLSSIMHHMKHW